MQVRYSYRLLPEKIFKEKRSWDTRQTNKKDNCKLLAEVSSKHCYAKKGRGEKSWTAKKEARLQSGDVEGKHFRCTMRHNIPLPKMAVQILWTLFHFCMMNLFSLFWHNEKIPFFSTKVAYLALSLPLKESTTWSLKSQFRITLHLKVTSERDRSFKCTMITSSKPQKIT